MSSSPPIRIATRGSALALAQADLILAQCRAAFPHEQFELRVIKTTGDKLQAASLAGAELPKGLFTKEIEEALLRDEADLAVHSLKDLPADLPPGLELGAVTARADVRDVLICRDLNQRGYRPALSILALPHRATVATSSTRRAAQLLEQRPDLNIVPFRGNIGTRLRKLAEQPELDATLLAAAGLERLHLRITGGGVLEGEGVPAGLAATPLALGEMLPCVGQGALGIEIRANDPRIGPIRRALNHPATHACVSAERAFLQALGGGCNLSVAAYAELRGPELHLAGVSFLDAKPRLGQTVGDSARASDLGRDLATRLLE